MIFAFSVVGKTRASVENVHSHMQNLQTSHRGAQPGFEPLSSSKLLLLLNFRPNCGSADLILNEYAFP